MTDAHRMLQLPEAEGIVDSVLNGNRLPSETVGLGDALGRVLAVDQTSRVDLPPFDKSAMDGYAIPPGDVLGTYCVLETVAAGSVPQSKLIPGTAIKVMTGAPVPPGVARVVKVEDTSESDGMVTIHGHDRSCNIARCAEDVRSGDVVLRAPVSLGAEEIATLAACAVTEVEVFQRPRVAIVSTGDEIVSHPDNLAPGKIMDSNTPMLVSLCRRHHLAVVGIFKVPDECDATRAALAEAMDLADIVLVSGGVSMGEFDFVIDAMSAAGLKVHFTRVAVKPGKPTTFASCSGCVVIGLPGNPVSVYLMFHLFALRAVRGLTGIRPAMREISLPLAGDLRRGKSDRAEYVPSRIRRDGFLEPVEFHGSAHLSALPQTDGFFVVPVGVTEMPADERVAFLPLRMGGDL
jgi:molybdopterin molybdotransferase